MTSNDHKLQVRFDPFILRGMIEMTSDVEHVTNTSTHEYKSVLQNWLTFTYLQPTPWLGDAWQLHRRSWPSNATLGWHLITLRNELISTRRKVLPITKCFACVTHNDALHWLLESYNNRHLFYKRFSGSLLIPVPDTVSRSGTLKRSQPKARTLASAGSPVTVATLTFLILTVS